MFPHGILDASGLPGGEDRPDVLARINEREREIERVLCQAHEAADATIIDAPRGAVELIAARRAGADRLAADAGDKIVALAHRETAAIRETAAREAAAILATPCESVEPTAQRMFAMVLPGAPGAGGVP